MSYYIDYHRDWFKNMDTWNFLICQYSTEIKFQMFDQYIAYWSLIEDL